MTAATARILALSCTTAVLCAVVGARGQDSGRVSAIVYPPRSKAIRVNHLHPAHRALPCIRCHVAAERSRSERDKLLPDEQACLPCHAKAVNRHRPGPETCGLCHAAWEPGREAAPIPNPLSTPRVHFSHAAHARRGATCTQCHGGGRRAQKGADVDLPGMRTCGKCHALAQSAGCFGCHWSNPAGQMRTKYREGVLRPPPWLLDMGHDADWVVRHRWVGADRGRVCATCHQESHCTKCHDGRRRPSGVHPNDWLALHAQQARRNAPRCSSCHTAQTFCAECHARLGLAVGSAPGVRTASRFHPANGVWVRGPVQHAREAQRSLISCVGCHAERDCIVCHGAQGKGSGFSPHPPGFRDKCRRLYEGNPRACRQCHGDDPTPREQCP